MINIKTQLKTIKRFWFWLTDLATINPDERNIMKRKIMIFRLKHLTYKLANTGNRVHYQYWVTIQAGNGQIMFQSEMFKTRQAAIKNIESLVTMFRSAFGITEYNHKEYIDIRDQDDKVAKWKFVTNSYEFKIVGF